MPSRKYDILVAGEINPDLVLRGNLTPEFGQMEKLVESADLTVGSSSAIFACGAARLGLKVGFVGLCGDDLFGRFMLEQMEMRGVDTSPALVRKGAQTGLSVILTRGNDRAILTYPGLISELTADEVPDALLSSAAHLHVASYFLQSKLQPGLPALFRKVHALGLTTSLDTNWDPAEGWQGIVNLLSEVDVFLPAQRKRGARNLGKADLKQGLSWLAKKCLVVVKRGAEGALYGDEMEILKANGIKMDVTDTIGAGDSFDAGFLYGFLKGWKADRSLKLAVACGSLSTRLAGGVAAQPTLEEALKYV